MASFSLVPEPTFKAKVDIPIPGKKAQKVELTFKWRDSDDFKAFLQGLESYDSDTDAVMDFVTGWELSDAFSRENVEKTNSPDHFDSVWRPFSSARPRHTV